MVVGVASLNLEKFEALRCTLLRPFDPGQQKRVAAVKVVDMRGSDAMRVLGLPKERGLR